MTRTAEVFGLKADPSEPVATAYALPVERVNKVAWSVIRAW